MLAFGLYFLPSAKFEKTLIVGGHEDLFFILALQVDLNQHYLRGSDLNEQR